MKNSITFYVVLFLFTITCFSQSQRELYQESTVAYQTKNYDKFLKITRKLDSLRPFHPTYTYNLAVAYSLNQNDEMAICVLNRLVLMNYKTAFEKDSDFDNLKQAQGFKKLLQLKLDLEKIIENSEKVVSLSEKELHPESVHNLEKHKLWLASSIRHKKIVSFDSKTGLCSDWFVDSQFSTFAMKADVKEQYLWVATAAMPEMVGFSKEFEGKAEVLKIDIKSRKIVKRFPVQGNHVFGDLVLDNQGNVYVSDSGEALIYKISDDKISVWLDLKAEAFNLQGLTFNKDETKLFIADYLKGILVIDINDPQNRSWLEFPNGTIAKGIDGMVFYDNSVIAIHNGVKPIRVIQYRLNERLDSISGFKVVDNNRPEFDEPALTSIVKNKLYFFANSPWKAYDQNGNLDTSKFENPALYEYKLK